MKIVLTKLTDERHRMSIIRDDGTSEQVELATREFLFHDLLHYCLETEAGLNESFWGSLAAGKTLVQLSPQGMTAPMSGEIALTEMVVGPLSFVYKGDGNDERFVIMLRANIDARGVVPPDWLTLDLVARIRSRFTRLTGEYRALPRGESMEIVWPLNG